MRLCSESFTAEFSGKSGSNNTQYTISGLNLSGSDDYVGLFGCASNANIHDVVLDNPSVSGRDSVGAILGYAGDNVTIKNSAVKGGSVTGNSYIGGLVGRYLKDTGNSTFNLANSYSLANVIGVSIVGGLVGEMGSLSPIDYATIQNSYFAGIASTTGIGSLGGILGENNLTGSNKLNLVNNLVIGKIAPAKDSEGYVGNFVGLLIGSNRENSFKTNPKQIEDYNKSSLVNFSHYCDNKLGAGYATATKNNPNGMA
ncbi:MAG: hypothetical protein QM533_05710 [Cytophagales bacterium]|nr:hypothetical protein [Cytophagales bacterium]